MSRLIAAVEIGTSKIVTLIGQVEGKAIDLLAEDKTTSQGVTKGAVEDVTEASRCVHASLRAAEEAAGVQVEEVYLAMSGAHLEGFANPGRVTVSGEDDAVSENDLYRASQEAKARALPPGRTYLCHVRSGYMLDGEAVEAPVHRQGHHLEAFYWHVHGDSRRVTDAIHIINGYGQLPVTDVVLSSLASGTLLVSQKDKQLGTLVIDIGAGTTDYVLYRHGHVQRTGVIAVGGDHFTNDLAIALRISHSQAENLKVRYGSALVLPEHKDEKVMAVGDMKIGDRQVPRHSIEKVLFLRAQELFQIIANKLGSQLSPQNLPGGVVLTGGGARLPQLTELAHKTFQLPVRIGRPIRGLGSAQLQDPEYATAVGVLHYALYGAPQDLPPPPPQSKEHLLAKMIKIFS